MTSGENNPRATLSDGEIEMIRTLYEGDRDKPKAERHWTASRLAEKFETSLRNVWYIVGYHRRVQSAGNPDKRVEPTEGKGRHKFDVHERALGGKRSGRKATRKAHQHVFLLSKDAE